MIPAKVQFVFETIKSGCILVKNDHVLLWISYSDLFSSEEETSPKYLLEMYSCQNKV